jgi:hypothetical protein
VDGGSSSRPNADDFAVIQDPIARLVAEHWLAIRRPGQSVPLRSDLDLPSIARALPNLMLIEREASSPPVFRVRLAGEEINRLFRRSVKGLLIDDLFAPEHAGTTIRLLQQVLDLPAVCHQAGPLYRQGSTALPCEKLSLPLVGGSGNSGAGRHLVLSVLVWNWDLDPRQEGQLLQVPSYLIPIV